jgi:lipopolysaccharide heptosyltransferase II
LSVSGDRADRWRSARRLLAVRLDALGDLVMTGPALRALKAQAPDRHVTLLTSPAGAEAATLLPGVDETIAYQAPWMKPEPRSGGSDRDFEMVERLRAGEFDGAMIFTVYSQSPLPAALLLHLADVPLTLAHCRENPYHLLSDWVRESEPEKGVRHEVRRHLDLVAAIGASPDSERLQVEPSTQAREQVDELLAGLGLTASRDWLVVHPGANAPSRRYPPELFAEAVRALATRYGLTPLLTGSEHEKPLVERVAELSAVPLVDLAGRLDLHQLTALLARAPVLLSNNSGPIHLAAGVGTPVVDLYALTNPQHTPWQVPSRVLYQDVPCRFCYSSVCPEGHHACLSEVAPEEVVQAVAELTRRAGADGAAAAA